MLVAVVIESCTSPLDINTLRYKIGESRHSVKAKYFNLTFEGDDVPNVQDGCDVSWYSGITDSITIDTAERVAQFRLNIPDIKVNNTVIGKYTELRGLSLKFDSLFCSNINRSIEGNYTDRQGAELTILSGWQTIKLSADGKKTKVIISATEYRMARMVQFKILSLIKDTINYMPRELKFAVKGTIVY